ncbi:beta-propeller fold lactonase family protein [Mycobacterium sp.]|uniref:YVTN family beta-propeller repeat protein n=1 Tax=Mycobacterium sp. TaxID=1785 RepID=UPI003C716F4B
MNWRFPVWRAGVSGVASLATATGPDVPVTVFDSVRTTPRRARGASLADVADNDVVYAIPLKTPVSAPGPPARNALGTAPVGTFPTGVAVSPDGNRVYVANSGDDSVSVIDAESGNAALTIAVGHAPYGIALTSDGRKAFVANASGNSVSVIDTQAQVVTATIAVGPNPYGVAVDPDGERLYVTNQADGTLTVIDAVKSTIVVGGAPTGVAVGPEGRTAYVVDNESGRLVVVDTEERVVTATVRVGSQPAQVAITPDGSRAFVTNPGSGSVSLIDLARSDGEPTVTETIPVGAHPIGVAVCADGRFAYVTALDASRLSGTVTIIDTATGMTSTIHAGAPYGVAADPAGDYAYVTDFRANAVSLIEAAAGPERPRHEAVRAITTGRATHSVTADPDMARAFVIRSDDDAIEVIESSGESVTVEVGAYPSALVLSCDGTRAYVTNYEDRTLSIIDMDPLSDACNTVTATLDVGLCWATGVQLSGDGNRAYAVDEVDGHVSVIDAAVGSPNRDTVVGHVELGEPPAALRIAPNGRWAYAINHFDHAVWAVHTATNRVATIRLPAYPYRISLSPSGSRLYASLSDNGSICVIDTEPASATYHRIIARIRLGHGPEPVFTTAGTRAYVVKSDENSVAVINTADSSVKDIAVGQYPWDLAVSPDGRRAYVANSLDDSLSVISCATDCVTATIPVGAHPCRVAVCATGDRAFVVNSADDSVSVIDTATATVRRTIAVGRTPCDVAVSADGLRAFVQHRDGLSLVSL